MDVQRTASSTLPRPAPFAEQPRREQQVTNGASDTNIGARGLPLWWKLMIFARRNCKD
jgi:hypothetical protein